VEKKKTRTALTGALSTMNLEHGNDQASFANSALTRAEFTYSMVLNRIKIVEPRGRRRPPATSRTSCVRSRPGVRAQLPAIALCAGTPAVAGMDASGMASMPGFSGSARRMKPRSPAGQDLNRARDPQSQGGFFSLLSSAVRPSRRTRRLALPTVLRSQVEASTYGGPGS